MSVQMSAYETYVNAKGIYVPPRRTSALNSAPDDFVHLTSRNEDWKKIEQIVISLFQKKIVRGHEILTVSKNLNVMINSPGGIFLQEYYNDQLLLRGMIILREPLRFLQGMELINEITATWQYFYAEILPTLSAIFYKIESKTMPIRKVTLKAFKDVVIFYPYPLYLRKEKGLLEVFKAQYREIENNVALRHMLLMLQSTTDKNSPDLRLQELLTYVVKPFLGQAGLFVGPGSPVIRSCLPIEDDTVIRRKKSIKDAKSVSSSPSTTKRPVSVQTPPSSPSIKPKGSVMARRSIAEVYAHSSSGAQESLASQRQRSLPNLPNNPYANNIVDRNLDDNDVDDRNGRGGVVVVEAEDALGFPLSLIPAINISVEWTESAAGKLHRELSTTEVKAPSSDGPLPPTPPPPPPLLPPKDKIATNSSVGRTTNKALDTLVECGSGDELSLQEQYFV